MYLAGRRSVPNNAVLLTQYDELEELLGAFAQAKLNLLIIVGRPGVQKSTLVRSAVGSHACWIEGNATAYGLYCELHRCRDAPVVIDDVDSLYADRACIRLLKSLCQTEARKQLAWHARSGRLQGIPNRFETTSRVVILANDWKSLNANVAAVEDRGHLIQFAPSTEEVHRRSASWFWDQEVHDFVGHHLHLAETLSMRDYRLAWELKQAELPWQRFLWQRWGIADALRSVAELRADASFESDEARISAFVAQGHGDREAYLRLAAQLQPAEQSLPMNLGGTPPREPDTENWWESFQRGHRQIGEG